MSDETLTLAEIAKSSGVEIRTLRSWMAQGVVPGADSAGRNARYSALAVERARAVRALREIYGLSIADIRRELLTADPARIAAYAAMAGVGPATGPEAPSPGAPAEASAADYLRTLRMAGVFGKPGAATAGPAAATAKPPASALVRLAEALENLAAPRVPRRKARGEVRLHIPITPDLELAVRGDHPPEDIARFERIADLMRALLTGEAEND